MVCGIHLGKQAQNSLEIGEYMKGWIPFSWLRGGGSRSVLTNWIHTPGNKSSGIEQENVQGRERGIEISALQKMKFLHINDMAVFCWVVLENPKSVRAQQC